MVNWNETTLTEMDELEAEQAPETEEEVAEEDIEPTDEV